MQVLVLYRWYRCNPNYLYSPALLFGSPRCAASRGPVSPPRAQLLPAGGHVYSLTAAAVVTLPSGKNRPEILSALTVSGDHALPPTQPPPPTASSAFREKRRRVRRTEWRPNQRL